MPREYSRFSLDFRPLHSPARLRRYARAAVRRPDLTPVQPFVACPWCPDFDRTDPRHAGVSHGICAACAAKLEAEAEAAR